MPSSTPTDHSADPLATVTAAISTFESQERPAEMEGLPVEVLVDDDGTSRHTTLLDYITKENEELLEAGWSKDQVALLVQRLIELFEANESDEHFLDAGVPADVIKSFRQQVAMNFTIVRETDGFLRFATQTDKTKATAVREEFEPGLRQQLLSQGYVPGLLDKVITNLFEGRTADMPAVVPEDPMIFGRPASELSDEVPEIIDAYADAMEEHWGF